MFATPRSLRPTICRIVTALAILLIGPTHARAGDGPLPVRPGPPVETTPDIPHVQIGVEPVPELSAEFLRRVARLPGVDIRHTIIGMWGAKGFWILEDQPLSRPEGIYRGREFAHLHPDGSLHASLPPDRAREAITAGWAVAHPSAQFHERLRGFVMLVTPRTANEADVIFGLLVDGYNFVTGRQVRAGAFR